VYSIGYDIGSSSIKGAIINIETGANEASSFYPENEMEIISPRPGFAEQNPDTWWENVKVLTRQLLKRSEINPHDIKCIGISYQMHGLVVVDKYHNPLRNSIIWCDSRAVEIGDKAFNVIGKEYCLGNLLNSPGNFTASKLKWVMDNEPDVYKKIYKFMLPGDYIALKMTGIPCTTLSGLSEGIFWDFKKGTISDELIDYYKLNQDLISDLAGTFSPQGILSSTAAEELGLHAGTPVTYRAGDQPNNAFTLNVLNPGEVAATAGTSGVIYGVADTIATDKSSRVNNFAHVNFTNEQQRLGVLLCINGTGILNSWVRKNLCPSFSYNEMNESASYAEIGSEGISILPFGNGAERVLQNRNISSHICGLDFNRHNISHILRGVQEGIAFAFRYGFDIMKEMGIKPAVIRAPKANMFLSPVFKQTLANTANVTIELYNTDGAEGAARGAAYGAGYYRTFNEAFSSLKKIETVSPVKEELDKTDTAYHLWLGRLVQFL